jgi:elongation factor P
MYETSDLRKGLKIVIDGQPFNVVESQFVKPGKGQAFTRTKLKNLITGAVLERTFKTGEKLTPADVETRTMQYLYPEGEGWVFMDIKTYDQMRLDEGVLGDNKLYLLDGIEVEVLLYEGRAIDLTPPNHIVLEITETEPGFKGDTTSSITKPATTQTGLVVQVPPFIEQGESIKVDTRTGTYIERVKK